MATAHKLRHRLIAPPFRLKCVTRFEPHYRARKRALSSLPSHPDETIHLELNTDHFFRARSLRRQPARRSDRIRR
jgi:hypothetical protein